MEISRQCLESLYQFKEKALIDETCMRETIQKAVMWITNGADQGYLKDEKYEIRAIIQGIATLLLQSAKHAYTREELIEYTFQVGWTEEMSSFLAEKYDTNYQAIRNNLFLSHISVPKLESVSCEPVKPEHLVNGVDGIDLTDITAYYKITFHYRLVDGAESTSSEIVNSFQLQSVINELKSALTQCDSIIGTYAPDERSS